MTTTKAKSKPKPKKPRMNAGQYERHKKVMRERHRAESLAGRNIGPLPKVKDPARRQRALDSLREFCGYHPKRFTLPFSADQLETIHACDLAIKGGGKEVLIHSRGGGKTQIALTATEWAIFRGSWKNAYLVGANISAAARLIDAVKKSVTGNPLLLADFPEICHPARELQDIAHKVKGQHLDGARTHMKWGAKQIVFPTVAGSPASGALLTVTGIGCSDLRGSFHTLPGTGEVIRPQGVVLDDIQNDGTAVNPERVAGLLEVINNTVLGMEGPTDALTILCPGTIIAPNDVMESLSDRNLYPDWSGKIYKLLYTFPEAMNLWQEYSTIRADGLRRGDKLATAATEFYAARRAAMDNGSKVAWEHRYRPTRGEVSALQYAMNIFFDTPETFWREYQNEPKLKAELIGQLTKEDIVSRANQLPRGVVPARTNYLTAMVDVQQTLLYWLVAAWSEDFTGSVVDCGAWPEQERAYFTLSDANVPLSQRYKGAAVEGAIRQGLEDLTTYLRRAWPVEGGATMPVDRIGVDTGYQGDLVCEWARRSDHAPVILPTRGRGIGAKQLPMSMYTRKHPRERYGFHWRLNYSERRGSSVLEMDVNFWKSFVAARLRQAIGDRGALGLFGRPGTDSHRMLADHWTAEMCRPQVDELSGRRVEEWVPRAGNPDNHLWDCLIGSTVLASFLGANLGGQPVAARETTTKPRPTLAQIKAGVA